MIDIVIVNWNSDFYLEKCVNSIFNTSDNILINKVFIIDNNSSDNSLIRIPHYPKVTVIKNKENIGFSRACNQGFRLCSANYVLLLNPDTQLFESTLGDCHKFMTNNQDIDVLGCQLLTDDGEIAKSCARFPSPKRFFFDAVGLSKVSPALFKPATLMTDWDHKESRVVDQVMGAFMFMHFSVIEKAGYFDERFFVYFEELDFSKRVSELGGKSYYNSIIKTIHSENGTTKKVKGFRLFLILRSRLFYAKKHFSSSGYALVWASTFFIEPFSRVFQLLLQCKPNEIRDVLQGFSLLIRSQSVK